MAMCRFLYAADEGLCSTRPKCPAVIVINSVAYVSACDQFASVKCVGFG